MATPMSSNQNTYLSNLASGKNPDGSKASAGNIAWAKSQLGGSTSAPTSSTSTTPSKPTNTSPSNTSSNTVSSTSGNKSSGSQSTPTGSSNSGSSSKPAPAPAPTPAPAPVVTPVKPIATTYKDPTGTNQTGYIIDGKTYKDQQGTQRIDDGSIVTVGGTSYKMTNGAGVPVSTQAPAPTVKTPTVTTPTNVTATSYKDPTGATQTGYIINGKTYKDQQGTQRIDDGSVVTVNGVSYKMTNGAGVPVTTQTPTPTNVATIDYKDPAGATQKGYIINGKTYKDPQGTQRIEAGSVVTSGGKVFMMTSTGQGIDITNPILSEVYEYDPETGTATKTNKTLYNVDGVSYDGSGNVYRTVAGDNELVKAQNGTYYNAKTGEAVNVNDGIPEQPPIVSQDPAIQQLFDMIYNIASDEIKMDPTLTWEQAWARANQSLGPQYTSAMQTAMEGLDKNALQSGFFGQLPTEALKRNTMGSLEVDKLQAVNQLASELFGQSEESAYNKMNAAQTKQQNNISNLLSLLGIYTNERNYNDNRSDTEWTQNYNLAQLLGNYNGTPTLNYLEYQKPSSSGSKTGSGTGTEKEADNILNKTEVLDRIESITTVTQNKDGTTTETPDTQGRWFELTSMYNDGLINKTTYDNYVKGYTKGYNAPTQETVNETLNRWYRANTTVNFNQTVRNALSEGRFTKDQYNEWDPNK